MVSRSQVWVCLLVPHLLQHLEVEHLVTGVAAVRNDFVRPLLLAHLFQQWFVASPTFI